MTEPDQPPPTDAGKEEEEEAETGGQPELAELLQFTMTCLALGIPANKVLADFYSGLEDLRQSGSVSMRELADLHAKVAGNVEHVGQWTQGFVAGYVSGWSAAVLRLMETRDIEVEKDMRRAITTCPDAGFLTRLFDRAVTVTSADELLGLFAAERATRH
ncbi:hypothetical protein [Streptomyces sp. NPDC004065]|uniref:hypothetical protein n=1 Tax=Streptomyces sp. NPDC004065 TaxID=3364689 RepID=UPI003850EE76